MTKQDEAEKLWDKIEMNLGDRGCFNGIDDDVMEELEQDLIAVIRGHLSKLLRKEYTWQE